MSLGTQAKEKKELEAKCLQCLFESGLEELDAKQLFKYRKKSIDLWARNEQLTIKGHVLWMPRQVSKLIICSHSKMKIIS